MDSVVTKLRRLEMDNVVTKLRIILMGTLSKQFYDNPGIDSHTNLYIAEVAFIKNAVASFTGIDIENNDTLHCLACDFVDEIHREFDDGCDIQG